MVLNEVFFNELVEQGEILLKHLKKEGKSVNGARVFELGTGWNPILPVLFFLCGADEILTVDLRNLLRTENAMRVINKFLGELEKGNLEALRADFDEQRINALKELSEQPDKDILDLMKELRVTVKVGMLDQLGLERDSFDIGYSINVLEHVSKEALTPIVKGMYELTKAGGFQYHQFGCYDHFHHVDKSISKFNYLQFSESQWRLIDNDIQPQNRLRVDYFERLFEETGFSKITTAHSKPNLTELDKVELHSDFATIDREVVGIDYGTILAVK